MLSQLNAALSARKLPPLGFVNTFLYQNQVRSCINRRGFSVCDWSPSCAVLYTVHCNVHCIALAQDAFLDVVRGSNGGFNAVKGFDPASGLGTFSNETFSLLLSRLVTSRALGVVHP